MIDDQCLYWQRVFKVSLALVVALLVVGYLITPALFELYAQKQAGRFAALLFNTTGTILVVLLVWLPVQALKARFFSLKTHWPLSLSLIVMLSLLLYFAPEMTLIKSQNPMSNIRDSLDWPRFAVLHGIYQAGYLIVIIMLIIQTWLSRKMIVKSCV